MLLGLSVLIVAEGVFALLDWGRPTELDDPFVGFSDIHPLFELDESAGRYRVAASRRKFFAEASFAAEKGPRTFRIFCLGGSTVQGRPYSTPTSFPTRLEIDLRAADDRFAWEVINCGGISYASYRLVPILAECLDYQPDYIILCTGHNEFLEDRSYRHIKRASPMLDIPLRLAHRWRTFQVIRRVVRPGSETATGEDEDPRSILGGETNPILDYHDSLRAYHRDSEWHAGVAEHFRFNLRRIAHLARNAEVPLLLILPPSNLSDAPPFKSEHRADLTAEQLQQWEELLRQYHALGAADSRSIALLKQALKIDDQYAATWFELGQGYAARGLHGQARQAFIKARDLDVCPLRMTSPLEKILRDVADQEDLPLLDAHALLEEQSPHEILGGRYLVDHVHPGFAGHQFIARQIVRRWIADGLVQPAPEWQSVCDQAQDAHFRSLEDYYFLSGQRTLDALGAWIQGKADGPLWTDSSSR